jgi:hypothetical protein
MTWIRAYKKTSKYQLQLKEYNHERNRDPEFRKYQRAYQKDYYNRNPAQRYYHHAKKLGLTVAEYRKRLAA